MIYIWCNITYPFSVLVNYKLTLVYFLVKHGQQHIVVWREQLVDPGSLEQGAENLQQLDEKYQKSVFTIQDLNPK